MMRHSLPLVLLMSLLLPPATSLAQRQLTLSEAFSQRLIDISARGLGGFQGQCLGLAIKNLSGEALTIEIPAGHIFASKDSTAQDLIVTAPQQLVVPPGQVQRQGLYTMCTQPWNMSPAKGDVFHIGQMAEEKMLKVAQAIAEGQYQNGTGQAAVWTVARGRADVSSFYGPDEETVRTLAVPVSEATGVPLSAFNFRPRPIQITAIRTSFDCLIPRHLQQAHLVLTDAEGTVVESYFQDRRLEKGFMHWRIGVNHTRGDSAELYLRLLEGEAVVAERRVWASDTIAPTQRLNTQALLVFDLAGAVRADAGLYDAAGNLYFLLAEDQPFRPGLQRQRYIMGKDVPAGQDYFVRIVAGDSILAETPLNPDAPATVHPVRTLRGAFEVEVQEVTRDARLAIYDADGTLKRVMYDIARLNPGRKRFAYDFDHVQGPGAVFFVRLTQADGDIIWEKKLEDTP